MIFSLPFLSLFILILNTSPTKPAYLDGKLVIEQTSLPPNNDVNLMQTLEKLNETVQNMQGKLDIIIKEQQNSHDSQDQFKLLEKKLDAFKSVRGEQEMFGTKLTALEFTLNHVLSKVVYLSDNSPMCQIDGTEPSRESKKIDDEILSRLGNLIHQIQNIERNNCRRSTIPAAAGPILFNRAEPLIKLQNLSSADNSNIYIEDLLRKLENRLNTISRFSNLAAELKQLPTLIKQNGQELTRILELVNQLSNENAQQHDFQRMLEYCQGVSEEFSNFAGSSDGLLKRIESIVQDTKERIDNLQLNGVDEKKCLEENPIKNDKANQTIDKTYINEDKPSLTEGNITNPVIQLPKQNGCHDLTSGIHAEGIYAFNIPNLNEAGRDFNLRYCKFHTDERAWTVIAQRGPYDVQENFNRSWIDYRNGFGDLNKDFWFGNEFIHRLTYFNNYELLIELENFDEIGTTIFYGTFGLDSERVNYNLFVGDYKGPGPDSLSYHNFMDFSTYDRHNDKSDCCPCAVGYGSGWWFDNCLEANLNGIYRSTPDGHNYVGIIWEHWMGDYSLKATRMLIRPKNMTSNNIDHEDP